ncbi:transcription elongation factor GreA [Candidatus Wolfebacteria bacterium RIFCSPLOWO2_01_FULL_45_19]|uniref:Transcription elongation factor GreA n=1 Tax=Candidatus Wolfebacteria bacterium RIFCSPLOWO2_01_FULL_45_19 TaxID=1802557 RepID=A0A1F8DT14_9BACT|nr:MAG: transcription elongation factor GreA [Candidatus Wolfebacteria bacterium RIFCSPLOWO2_01_FULL_45_19]
MVKQYFTSERLEELKKELHELKTKRRKEVADRLKRAKEYGDLSENSEYSEAKDEQSQLESRIFELEETIKNAQLIQMTSGRAVVQIGSTVIVQKDDKSSRYTIVGSNEAKPEDGKISNESPLGKAFLGKKPGETAIVTAPSGKIEYKIIAIE